MLNIMSHMSYVIVNLVDHLKPIIKYLFYIKLKSYCRMRGTVHPRVSASPSPGPRPARTRTRRSPSASALQHSRIQNPGARAHTHTRITSTRT